GGVPTHCGIPSWRKASRVKEIEPCCRRQNSLLHSARESQGARTGTLHRWELGNPETSRSAIPYPGNGSVTYTRRPFERDNWLPRSLQSGIARFQGGRIPIRNTELGQHVR